MIDWPTAIVALGVLATIGVGIMKTVPPRGMGKMRRVEDCTKLHTVLCKELEEIKDTAKDQLEDLRKIEVHLANLEGRLGSAADET